MTKTIRHAFLLFFLCGLICNQTIAQISPENELVISMHSFSIEKSLPDFNNTLSQTNGVVLAGTCKHLDIIMLRIDLTIHASKDKVITFLKNAGHFFDVREISIKDVQSLCKDPLETKGAK